MANSYNAEKLLFRRQFILGPRFIEKFPTWNKFNLNKTLFVTLHPDLPYKQVSKNGFTLTLLGYIINSEQISSSDEDILYDILSKIQKIDDIFENLTDDLGGRWILIIDDGNECKLFHDAAGLRQVCYTNEMNGEIWCASTPGIIAEELGFTIGSDALEFINSPQWKNAHEYWWPGMTTPFREISQLLPNFYLDLKHCTYHRYWPNKYYPYPAPYKEGIKKSAELLKKLCNAAFQRFPVEGTISAGYDTRTILAASKDFAKEIEYLTLIYWSYTQESTDSQISTSLLKDLNLKHKLVQCRKECSPEFWEIYKRNVTTAHLAYASINETLMEYFPQEKVAIKGTVSSEIIREQYIDKTRKKDGKNFAQISGFNGNKFMEKHLQIWLDEALPYAKKFNVNINELYGWEQQTGRWQAMTQAEGDIAQEVFVPFNCRNLIMYMLQVHDKYRRPFYYKLYEEMVKYNWLECNAYPMNPHKRGWKPQLKNILRQSGFYPFFITLFYKFHKQKSHI